MPNLIRVAYSSEAVADFPDARLEELLSRARRHNQSAGITGLLLLEGRSFFQIIEGEPAAIDSLYVRIGSDPRHKKITKLIQEPIEARDFAEWSMALARVPSAGLKAMPGLSNFFESDATLRGLDEGRARQLLTAFKGGRWRA